MKYRVEIDSLEHDGKRRQPGEEVELTEDQAGPLVAAGAVTPPEKPAKPAGKKGGE